MDKVTEKISYFSPPITNTTPLRHILIEDFHRLLTGGAKLNFKAVVVELRSMADLPKADRQSFKSGRLPAVTPHGTFTKRSDNDLIEPSGLIVVDIDSYGWGAEPFMRAIKADPYLRLAFRGPSGAGSVKLFFRIDPALIAPSGSGRMRAFLNAAEAYLRETYSHLLPDIPAGGRLLDESGKDLARACFASYDPEAYLGPEEGARMDAAFIERYRLPEEAPPPTLYPTPTVPAKGGTQAPANFSLDGLAAKHLKPTGSHHGEVVAFVSAAKACGHPREAVKAFLADGEWVSSDSGESAPHTLEATINDLWQRYPVTDSGVVQLKDGKIGYGFLTYTFSKAKGYQHDGGLFNDGILRMLHGNGFCRRRVGSGFVLARKVEGILEEVSKDEIKTFAQTLLEAQGGATFEAWGNVHTTAAAAMETFLRASHAIFNDTWLAHLRLDETPLLRDEEDAAYIPFKNGVLKVGAGLPTLHPWSEFSDRTVWRDQVIPRELHLVEEVTKSHFYRFLSNVAGGDDKRLYSMMTALGYMMHHHNRPSEGQCVILNDEVITDLKTPMGGSGKGVFVQAIKTVRKTAKVDGKALDSGDRFKWQSVGPDTQVVWIDDVKRDFDFSLLHSNLTDGWSIERKNLPVLQIPAADSPKTIIASNSIIKGDGTTNKRRQFIVEIGDHYSKRIRTGLEQPIREEHGCLFFSDEWPVEEWAMFYSFMAACLQAYFEEGLVYFAGINIERNRLRQRTSEEFCEWVDARGLAAGVTYETKRLFEEYQGIYGSDSSFKQKYFSEYLKRYAESKRWEVDRNRGVFKFVDPSAPKSGVVGSASKVEDEPF